MAKDRGGRNSSTSIKKEGWLSLQGTQGQARPVRGVLSTESFTIFSVTPRRQASESSVKETSAFSGRNLGDSTFSGNGDNTFSLPGQGINISYKSTETPHPGTSDLLDSEFVAHGLLFSPEEVASYEAVVLASSVLEVANYMSAYVELLLNKSLSGISPGSKPFLNPPIPLRVAGYCEAVLSFPSIVLNTTALASILRLVSSLGSLDAQLAEQVKLKISKAQEHAQKVFQLSFTPEVANADIEFVRKVPVSKSKWGPKLLKFAENAQELPISIMLEPGFAEEFADQAAAFNRKVWRHWSPISDLSLLFHTPNSSSAWRLNPLVFDVDSPHFLGSLASRHILNSDIDDWKRAQLMQIWISIAARLREQGDSVGWISVLLILFDPTVLRLSSAWTKVDQELLSRLAHGWGYEAFEVLKRSKIPFLEKKAFRTDSEYMGRLVSKLDCVPYFGDAIIHDTNPGRIDIIQRQLVRLKAIMSGWNSFVDSIADEVPRIKTVEDPAYQCLFAIWAQQLRTLPQFDKLSASLSIQPKLLGYYLPNFYQQVLPLSSGSMIPVLFTTTTPSFRLFPRSTLILASQPKQSNRPRAVLRRSSSFPPAGPPQTTGVTELDSGAREQLGNTASAHVLGQVVRDLLNVGTETIDVHAGIIFKAFPETEYSNVRSSRTSSIIETLTKRSSLSGRHVVVKSASMVRLVDVLVLGAGIFGHDLVLDTETHIATLLATYRSFCSPAEMLDMLQARVRCARGAARVLNEQYQRNGSYSSWKQIWQISENDDRTDFIAVRIISTVIALLHIWISDYFFDFMNDKFVMEAGITLITALRHELSVANYPEAVIAQCKRVTGSFSRHQFSFDRDLQHTPSWLPCVFDNERQSKYHYNQAIPPELPVTSLERDSGLESINTMVDELNSIVADAFSRITIVDWIKLFEVLEQQAASRLGLFNYASSSYASESDVVIQDIFSWLRNLQVPGTKNRVLDLLPEPIVALVRLHASLVSYFAAQVADPSLAHAHERRDRMTFVLKMLGVLRSRMRYFNLGTDFEDQQSQHIPSLLESAISSSILLPESRAYATSWQAAGNEVARMFPQLQPQSHSTNEGNPNTHTIFIPFIPMRQGHPTTVCLGWIIERLLEIVCCVPNTSVEHPELINFDKRRYAYNLIKNMSSEFRSSDFIDTPPEIVEKYFFLFGEYAKAATVPTPLIDRKLHKESLNREGRSRNKVFVDIVNQELEKLKSEARMLEKLERRGSHSNGTTNSQSFYGLPVSQSSTSLYSKRISRLMPSTSTVDVASIIDGNSSSLNTAPSSAGSTGSSAATSNAMNSTSPSKRLPSQSKKSRFGGLFRAVRPLSVLGGNGAAIVGSNSSAANISTPSVGQHSHPGSLYAHQTGSVSSLQSNPEELQENPWAPDESVDLNARHPLSDYNEEDWMELNHFDIESFNKVQVRSSNCFCISYRSGQKPESLILRATSKEEANEWIELTTSLMNQKLLESTRVFGVPLNIVCRRENRNVPAFLESLLSQIEDRGLDEVGIYRISGSLATVNGIKQWFDQGNTSCKQNDPRWSDINAIAGCIKLYLRELPDPLMTDHLLPEFMLAIEPEGVNIEILRDVIQKLPAPNYYVLERISKHLKHIVDHSLQNKMNVQNIAIVFSVNFLPPVAMSQMGGMQQLVSTLVLKQSQIFSE